DAGLGDLEHRDNDRTTGVLSVTQRVKAGPLGYHTFKAGVDYELATYNSITAYTGPDADTHEALKRGCNIDPMTQQCTELPVSMGALPGKWQQVEYYGLVRALSPQELAGLSMNPPVLPMLAAGQHLCNANRAICGYGSSLNANTADQSIGAFL